MVTRLVMSEVEAILTKLMILAILALPPILEKMVEKILLI